MDRRKICKKRNRVSGALPGVKHFNGTQDIKESWVKVNGLWYYVPKE